METAREEGGQGSEDDAAREDATSVSNVINSDRPLEYHHGKQYLTK